MAMAEQTKVQIPGLDDYAVAADLLDERGFGAVAASLREMRRRVLDLFCDPWAFRMPVLKRTWVVNGWEYASDARILIRLRTSQDDTPPFGPDEGGEQAIRHFKIVEEKWLNKLSEPGLDGCWRPLPRHHPRPTKWDGDEIWEAWQYQRCHVAGRDIANEYVWRMSKLPEVEVLDDRVDDYDYQLDVSLQPLRFRFRCGEGVVMPMLPDEASATQAAEREAPGEESVVESRDLRDGVMALRRDTT